MKRRYKTLLAMAILVGWCLAAPAAEPVLALGEEVRQFAQAAPQPVIAAVAGEVGQVARPMLRLRRDGHWLIIAGTQIPGGEIRINYLEAYCRANSTEADWVKHTVIRHTNELISASADGKEIRLRDKLADGVVVDHLKLRLGGLAAGETKDIKGKIYIVPNDVPALVGRYQKDFAIAP